MKTKFAIIAGLFLAAISLRADEGMWLYNQPPRAQLKERYNFDATDEWLAHLQKSSVRFNSGGSGSFVSEDGLLITNNHIGEDAMQKLGTKDKDYLRDGFSAHSQAEELKCLDLELNVLQSIEDVTDRVNAAIPKGAGPDVAFEARRKAMAGIEKESLDATGLRSNIITLWKGGAYHLYRFKRYTDVRLVFSPGEKAAFYGGDPDNFEFPRQDLDICFLRAYEDGKPAKIKDFLRFSPAGPKEGDLVFVSGHPGHTNRLLTTSEIEELRDHELPFTLGILKRKEVMLANWSARNAENARRAKQELFGIKNARKALDGRLAGLLDPELYAAKARQEEEFRAKLAGNYEALGAFDKITAATRTAALGEKWYALLEEGQAFNCDSFHYARLLLRAGDELPLPNGERLREYTDSNKAPLELVLFSAKPIYPDLEILNLTDSLTFFANEFGADDPLVKKILDGKSPHARAVELVSGTRMRDAAFRKQLYQGGAQAVQAAQDPMIELARIVDRDARNARHVTQVLRETIEESHATLDKARQQVYGTSGYPDATFTLRLSFGTVKGYEEDGRTVAPFTTIGSLYAKAAEMKNTPPFDLTPLWIKSEHLLNPATPLNFVSTNDIIGGNSGSPVVNRAAEFVGIIFDGNLQSLYWDEAFSDKQARAISVDSAAIIEALDKVYEMKALVDELKTGKLAK